MTGLVVISQTQLDALRGKIEQDRNVPQRGSAQKARARLAEEQAARWAETILAERVSNARIRAQRAAEAEALRVKQDEEDAAALAAKRRQIVAATQAKMFQEQDSVRGLRSKILLSDIDVQQRQQMALAAQQAALERDQHASYLDQRNQTLQAQALEEQRKAEAAKHAAQVQKQVQLAQLEDMKTRILADRAATWAEGLAIKQRTLEAADAEVQREIAARERACQADLVTTAANDFLLEMRRREKVKDAEADAAIAAYAAHKEAVVEERRRQQEAGVAAKEAVRQRNIVALEAVFLKAKAEHDTKLEREVQEAEDTAAADDAARVAYQKATWRANTDNWEAQLEARRQAAATAKLQAAAERAALEAEVAAARAAEAEEAAQRLARNRKALPCLDRQVSHKQRRAIAAKLADYEEAAQQQKGEKEARAAFEAYAAQLVGECRAVGKQTLPMDLFLQQYAKPPGLSATYADR